MTHSANIENEKHMARDNIYFTPNYVNVDEKKKNKRFCNEYLIITQLAMEMGYHILV